MAIKNPLVLSDTDSFGTELKSTDTLSTSILTDSTDKRFITDEQKDIICKNLCVGIVDTTPPTLTDNGDGTATISSCTIAIRDNSNFTGYVKEYTVSGNTFTFTDGEQEYIIVDYNSGTPAYTVSSTPSSGSDTSLVYIVWRVGTTIHSISSDSLANGLPNKINARLLNVDPYSVSRDGGLIISETSTPNPRTILVTSAIVYAGVVPNSVLAYNSSVDDMYKVVNTPTGWTFTKVTQYNNTHYNPSNLGEVALDNNKYVFNLFYRSIGDDKDVFFVESENQYNSASEAKTASEEGRSSIPKVLQNHCMFVGRSVIEKDQTTGETTPFIRRRGEFTTFIPMHNELSNIQGGTSNEYYHTTSAQNTIIEKLPSFGNVDSGDYANFENDGTLFFYGNATCWDDIQLSATSLGSGASAPDLININSSGIYLMGFDGGVTTEQLFGSFEIPHDYAEGTTLVPHIHWLTTTTNIGTVKWFVDYWRVDGNGTTVPSTPTTISATGTSNGIAWEAFKNDSNTIDGTGITIGDQVAFRLYRDPTQDTYPDDAVVLTFGIHYQKNSLGSRLVTTK